MIFIFIIVNITIIIIIIIENIRITLNWKFCLLVAYHRSRRLGSQTPWWTNEIFVITLKYKCNIITFIITSDIMRIWCHLSFPSSLDLNVAVVVNPHPSHDSMVVMMVNEAMKLAIMTMTFKFVGDNG